MLWYNVSELKCYGVLPTVTCVLSAFPKNHCIDAPRSKFLFYLFSTRVCVCVCVMCMSVYTYVHMCLCGSTCTCVCMHVEVQSWCWMSSSMARCLLRYGLLLSRAHQILASLAIWLILSTCECLDYRWLSHLADFLWVVHVQTSFLTWAWEKLN